MYRKGFRANSTDINRSPITVRYLFVLKLKEGRDYVSATTTFRTLRDNLKAGEMEYLRVVDLKGDTMRTVRPECLESLMLMWRDNYFDPDWEIPPQYFKKKKISS